MTAQGPRKGESSSRSMRKGFRAQPARSVRGSSRRIMSMRFRPANIRVINRRVCSWAVIGSAVPNKTCLRPTSGNTSRPVAHVKNKSKQRQARTRLDRVAPYQNLRRRANCMIRASVPRVVIDPPEPPETSRFGKPRWVVLARLNSSHRNWIDRVSINTKSLCNPKSAIRAPGARRILRPTLPYAAGVGIIRKSEALGYIVLQAARREL
jgi:hypothetical protein